MLLWKQAQAYIILFRNKITVTNNSSIENTKPGIIS